MRHIAIAIGVFFGLVGCGSVDDRGLGDASGAGGELLKVDGAVDMQGAAGGAPGTGGIAAIGGASGAAGAPGRPLGAGCTENGQCGSGICDSATSMCCDGAADACNTCVNGYLTVKKDGTNCGVACGGTNGKVFTSSTCQAGVCTTSAPIDCTQQFCVPHSGTGHPACAANPQNLCETPDAGGGTGCVCYLVATVNDPSCP